MKTAYSFLIAVLLATAIAGAATTSGESTTGVLASQGSSLSGFMAKRGGFRMPWMGRRHDGGVHSIGTDMGPAIGRPRDKALGQSTSSITASQVTKTDGFRMSWMKRGRDERVHGIGTHMNPAIGRSGIISDKKNIKVCVNKGHCYNKILVCPKKCGTLHGIEKKYLPGPCIFNCKKCIAHC